MIRDTSVQHALSVSEARIHALFEAAVDGIISIDEHGTIQTINPAAERMFGYSGDEVLGRNVNLLMPAPYREAHDGYLAAYLATGQKKIIGIGREALGLRKDGAIFPIDLSVAEARLADERIFVGIIRDITDRKSAEAALEARNEEVRAMTQQLWQAAKLASVGELAASIAHELNNPLGTVSLRIESVLGRTPQDDPRRRSLEIIAQETRRMGDLVANLLQFARRGAEQVSTVEVQQELTKAVELVRHHLRKRSINVVQQFAAETPTIYADRQKLRQVFLNLLTNASDAMPSGGTLTLRTEPATLADGAAAVCIEVADTGVGIPPQYLQRVLEPFFTTKEEGKGTGLGLPICRRIIQEHNGILDISSTPDTGTAIRIVLPVKLDRNVEPLRRPQQR